MKQREFDKIKTIKRGQRQNLRKSQTCVKTLEKQSCNYCGSCHTLRHCTFNDKKYAECGKVNNFRKVCKSGRIGTALDLEQEPDQNHEEEEDNIKMMNKKSIIFNRVL